MTEQELRALVRQAIARHAGAAPEVELPARQSFPPSPMSGRMATRRARAARADRFRGPPRRTAVARSRAEAGWTRRTPCSSFQRARMPTVRASSSPP